MNKIYELHKSADTFLLGKDREGDIAVFSGELTQHSQSAHAKVTEDIACKFKDWCDKNSFYESGQLHVSDKIEFSGCVYTTSELFQEFIKTL